MRQVAAHASRRIASAGVGGQLISYVACGSAGAFTDYLLFAILGGIGTQLIPANVVSVLAGIGVSYLLNSRFTFAGHVSGKGAPFRFCAVGLSGLALSTACLAVLISLGMAALAAKAMTMPLVVAYQFTVNRLWTFRTARSI